MFYSESEVKVRYAETDAMAVVHHANYIVWFEHGRTEFLETIGHPYPEIENQGYLLPVINVHVDYNKAFRYGDRAFIKTSLKEYNRLRLTLKYEIYNSENYLCVCGTTTHVLVKKSDFAPINLAKKLPNLHDDLLKVLL